MSGHSKWAKIKHAKGITDAKRGAIFTKIAKNITLAASEAGGDPSMNFSLRLAMDKAKAANMPSENIERAIKKGIGEGNKTNIQRVSYEALGSAGVVFIIDCQTDNTNRTVSEVRKVLDGHGAKMASLGSVSWQFSEKGLIVVEPAKLKKSEKYGAADTYEAVNREELEMQLMEISGIEDITESSYDDEGTTKNVLDVYTDKTSFIEVLKQIEALQYKVVSKEIIKVAKEPLSVDQAQQEKVETLVEALEDHDDVDEVWTNLKA